jgi:hypothetical protein
LETLEVDCFVVGDTVAPAHKHDALPLKGQGTDGGGIGFAAGELIFNKHFGPSAVEHRLAGVFEEALVSKVRPGPASMDPVLVFAAFLSDRSYAAILLDSGGALVARALTTKSAGQARALG